MTTLHNGQIVDDEPICAVCVSSVEDVNDEGVCEYCAETPRQRRRRISSEFSDAFMDGRPMGSDDY